MLFKEKEKSKKFVCSPQNNNNNGDFLENINSGGVVYLVKNNLQKHGYHLFTNKNVKNFSQFPRIITYYIVYFCHYHHLNFYDNSEYKKCPTIPLDMYPCLLSYLKGLDPSNYSLDSVHYKDVPICDIVSGPNISFLTTYYSGQVDGLSSSLLPIKERYNYNFKETLYSYTTYIDMHTKIYKNVLVNSCVKIINEIIYKQD